MQRIAFAAVQDFEETGVDPPIGLKNISKLHQWPLYNVLLEKYRLKDVEARSLASFLNDMLEIKENAELRKDYNACIEAVKILTR